MNAHRWLVVAMVLGITQPAYAQDDWSGKRVILKRPGIRIGYSDADGKQVFVAELTNLSYAVIKDDQGFLRVRHRGETGWFSKTDALLPEEAVAYFAERSRSADAKDSFPLAYLGWAHKERQQFDLAVAAYDSAIKRDPRPDWFNNRGLLYLETKKYDRAIADFSEAIKRAPKFVMAYENRASAYSLANKSIAALDDWNEVLRQDPGNGPALMRRAKIYADQKEFAKALADMNAALKDDPTNVAVLVERGQLHADLRKTDAALADFSEAIRLDATNAENYLARAQLYTDKKEFASALADVETAIALAPNLADARLARGWNRFMIGEFEKANEDYAKALEINPNLAAAYNSQAWLWATCPEEKYRDGKKALDFAKKAVVLTQGKEPAILDTQAAALAEIGDFDQAVQLQERTVRALAADSELLADARARLEMYRKKEAYRQAIAK
jgi:tetratricopeptide (TPR) repeat protein